MKDDSIYDIQSAINAKRVIAPAEVMTSSVDELMANIDTLLDTVENLMDTMKSLSEIAKKLIGASDATNSCPSKHNGSESCSIVAFETASASAE